MAARINPTHLQVTRDKIQTSQLINRLQDNAMGLIEPELSTGRIRSIEALINRTLPTLTATDVTSAGEPVSVIINKPSGD
jgi:hypothetical protein